MKGKGGGVWKTNSSTYQHDYVRSLQYHYAYNLTNCHLALHEEHHEVVPEDTKNIT